MLQNRMITSLSHDDKFRP